MNRRSFFQMLAVTVGAVVGYSALAKAEERRRGGSASGATTAKASLVDPKDAGAKAVLYSEKGTDKKCKACIFYLTDKETTVSGKKAAPCQMPFATGKLVLAEGTCQSWAKKA